MILSLAELMIDGWCSSCICYLRKSPEQFQWHDAREYKSRLRYGKLFEVLEILKILEKMDTSQVVGLFSILTYPLQEVST